MRKQSGFTLMEVLFTLVVAGVLVGMAVPSFKTSVQNSRLVTQANDLLSMLLYAHSQAVTLNSNVIVCASSDQATCSGTNWAKGWIVCQPDCSTTTNILRVEGPLAGNNTLTNNATGSPTTLTYSPATGGPTNGGAFYFDLCDSRLASYGRAIYVYASGQARVSPTPGQQLNGTALTC